ncbi:MAG TPA: methyltransferase domain-containing protein [Candidatus Nanoarchaeia archaeon]|nr:methyltransferase domain-containing protein [Candidatus Nanoarchaeia archaeon]
MGKEQYDKIADEYSKMLNPTKEYVLIPMLKRLVNNISGKTVIDLGCGDGFFTRLLSRMRPAKIVGVDICSRT